MVKNFSSGLSVGQYLMVSCVSLRCRLVLGTAVFLILVIAKIIPEQIPDPIYVAGFFLSSNSYHILPDIAHILLHLQQQTSALRRYP